MLGKINKYAIPLILNSITIVFIGLVDQAMVGRISISAFAAVGLVSTSIYTVTGVLGMIAVSFNISGAISYGRQDFSELKNKLIFTFIVCLTIGLFFAVIVWLFNEPLLRVLFGIDGEFLSDSRKYINIICVGVLLNMLMFTFSSLFKILKKTIVIMYANITASLLNVILNYILIFGKFGFPKLGIVGAAIASIIALACGLFVYVFFARIYFYFPQYPIKLKNYAKTILKKSFPLAGQELLDSFVFVIGINAILSRMGTIETSAYTLIFNLICLLLMPMYAYSSASLTMVSEYWGKKDNLRLIEIPMLCVLMSILFYLVMLLCLFPFVENVIRLITDKIDLIRFTIPYVMIAMVVNIFNIPQHIYKCSLQSVEKEKLALLITFLTNIICILAMVFFFLQGKLDLQIIYIFIGINFFLLSVVFYLYYTINLKKLG